MKRCPCGCGVKLYPVGTKIWAHLGHGGEMAYTVSKWAKQDHWSVPVTFKGANGVRFGAIVARPFTVRVDDPILS